MEAKKKGKKKSSQKKVRLREVGIIKGISLNFIHRFIQAMESGLCFKCGKKGHMKGSVHN